MVFKRNQMCIDDSLWWQDYAMSFSDPAAFIWVIRYTVPFLLWITFYLLYFSREEKALAFAVGSRDALKLQKIQEHLDLSHDFQRPAVVHGDGL